jgi:hypothetical protein
MKAEHIHSGFASGIKEQETKLKTEVNWEFIQNQFDDESIQDCKQNTRSVNTEGSARAPALWFDSGIGISSALKSYYDGDV